MAQLIEGQPDPKRLSAEKRAAAVRAAREKHMGKNVKNMSNPEQTELLLALAQEKGWVDENGVLLPPE